MEQQDPTMAQMAAQPSKRVRAPVRAPVRAHADKYNIAVLDPVARGGLAAVLALSDEDFGREAAAHKRRLPAWVFARVYCASGFPLVKRVKSNPDGPVGSFVYVRQTDLVAFSRLAHVGADPAAGRLVAMLQSASVDAPASADAPAALVPASADAPAPATAPASADAPAPATAPASADAPAPATAPASAASVPAGANEALNKFAREKAEDALREIRAIVYNIIFARFALVPALDDNAQWARTILVRNFDSPEMEAAEIAEFAGIVPQYS